MFRLVVRSFVNLAGVAWAVWGITSCSSESASLPGADPCETVYAGQCGGTCSADGDCATGTYCGPSGVCTADCGDGARQCGDGQVCSDKGRCSGGGGIDGGGIATFEAGAGSADQIVTGGDGCPSQDVEFEKLTPTVMLLVDQSGSMTETFGSGTRWSVLHDALMNASTGLVKQLENEVRFGLALYTSHNGSLNGEACPLLQQVPIALNNYAAMEALYSMQAPDGDTPTGESIQAITPALLAYPEPGPKYILLVTDGLPDTCAQPNPENGQQQSIDAATQAFANGIRTIPIGVALPDGTAHLTDVANAGGGGKAYQADNPDALLSALTDIIGHVRTCTFTLNGTVDLASAGQGIVTLDGQPLGYGDANGWKLNGPSELEIVGSACDTIHTGGKVLSIAFVCNSYHPIK